MPARSADARGVTIHAVRTAGVRVVRGRPQHLLHLRLLLSLRQCPHRLPQPVPPFVKTTDAAVGTRKCASRWTALATGAMAARRAMSAATGRIALIGMGVTTTAATDLIRATETTAAATTGTSVPVRAAQTGALSICW